MAERKLIIPNVPGDALPEDLGSVLIITQHIPDEKEKQKKEQRQKEKKQDDELCR